MAKTPPAEFDELSDRISENVDFSEVYNLSDLISAIDEQYPLVGRGGEDHPTDHPLYKKVASRLEDEVIQTNLQDFIKEEIPEEEYLTDEQEEELIAEARGAYSKKREKEISKRLEEAARETVTPRVEQETKADAESVEDAAESYLRAPRIPEYDAIKREAELTQKLARGTERPSTTGIYRRLGIYGDILSAFSEPRSSNDVAELLGDRRPEVSRVTFSRDIRRFNFSKRGYTETVVVDGVRKQVLTDKGRKAMEDLR